MKYQSEIVEIGSSAIDMYEGLKSLILFNDSIADEMLREISIIHKVSNVKSDIEVGDEIIIGENVLYVTAVGNVAMDTFRNIGHTTLRFTGEGEVNLPGEIVVYGNLDKEITAGTKIIIKK